MGRLDRLLPVVAAATLLTACGDASGDAPPPVAPPSSAPPSASPTASASADTSHLKQQQRDAFQAAMAAYPGADLDKCTLAAPLNDQACGAALTAASNVAADTALRLRASSPEYADLLYPAVFTTADAVQDAVEQLRDPIPCYGLSNLPQPPPPLMAEAQSICAEGADIAKATWRIFLSVFDE
jgi:hypothetical protein